jgi:hypothetical protein
MTRVPNTGRGSLHGPRAVWLPVAGADRDSDWSAAAEWRVRRLPPVVRQVVVGCVERYARSRGAELVTPAIVRAARAAAGF